MPRIRTLAGAIAALLFSAHALATGGPFNNVIVFGDSLSDAGNISLASHPAIQPPLKFTTNPGAVTVQNVASRYGITLGPSLSAGSDYAWGGAGVLNNTPGTPAAVPTITNQVNAYLATTPVNPGALYSIWGGANDIFYAATSAGAAATAQQLILQNVSAQIAQLQASGATAAQIAAATPLITQQVSAQVTQQVAAAAGVSSLMTADQAQASVIAAASQEVNLIRKLQNAGAKTILVFNLPNIGATPQAAAQGAATAAALTGLSQLYNGYLNAGLMTLGPGIVPLNTYSLVNEIMANPTLYGFTNVSTPACGAGSSSVQCGPQGSGLPYTYAPGTNQTYLFADGVHPTTAADALLGQYVNAVLNAPGTLSVLGEAPLASISAQTQVIRQQMRMDQQGSGTRFFSNINYSDQTFDATSGAPKTTSNNYNLTLGMDRRVAEALSVGVALNLGQSNARFSGGGGYQLQDISGAGYLTYHQGGGYIGGYLDFGVDNFSDIHRNIALGTALRIQTGKTNGSHFGGGLTGGWWFDIAALRTGPFATLDWQTVRIDGYNEAGHDSTTMWFDRQQRNALVSTLGWRLEGHWQAGGVLLSPYAEVAWNHDSQANARQIIAGLNTMNGEFSMTGYIPAQNWGSGTLGLKAQFTKTVTGWLDYSSYFSNSSQRYNSINLGVRIAL
jgi:outer membrane lipase/esterase